MTIEKHAIWLFDLVTTICEKSLGRARASASSLAKGICLGLLAISFTPRQTAVVGDATQFPNLSDPLPVHEAAAATSTTQMQAGGVHPPLRANFELEPKSHEAQSLADWVVDSGDNLNMPFVIVDKKDAKVFVFGADGQLRGAAPALLGLAVGDDNVPGIGDRALKSIRPEERTTPAGRFVSSLDHNLRGQEIIWVDYVAAISMHLVTKKRLLRRLATPTPLDNRISYGCINITTKFFKNVVRPAFTGTNGIVYVLPETKLSSKVFGSYDVEKRSRL